MKNHLSICFSSLASNIGVARIAVATFATALEFTIGEVEEIKVAVSEAVSNSVLHGYPDSDGYVYVNACICEDTLTVEIEDKGKGIEDINKAKEPGYTTIPDHMGLGFSFMESFTDKLEICSSPGQGTKIRMVKRKCN